MSAAVGTPEGCPRCGQPHPRCAAHKRDGNPCGMVVIRGGRTCKMHGGKTPIALANSARRLALAEANAELDRLGRVADVEPGEAMLAMVQEAAANVAAYRMLVQRLELDTAEPADHPSGIDDEDEAYRQPALAGAIAGRVDPQNWKAAPHVWVTMYDAERDKLVRWSKLCLDAGVAERRIRLAEAQAEQLAGVVRDVVDGMVAALAAAGLPEDVLASTVTSGLPGIMRAAFEKAHAIEVESREGS